MNAPLLVVGGGKMGSALIAGLHATGAAPILAVDPAFADNSALAAKATLYLTPDALPAGVRPQAMIFAVKPQHAETILPHYRKLAADALSISVMAGITLGRLAALLGLQARLVRAMPNLPAAIGCGITVATATDPKVDRALATRLLEAVGEVAWIDRESQMNEVTAVSGSGPAYLFLLAEALEQAAVAQGLEPDLARRLARATLAGASALMVQSGQDAAALRRQVTSPGGTTAAALDLLLPALPPLLASAVAAAAARSRALAGA